MLKLTEVFEEERFMRDIIPQPPDAPGRKNRRFYSGCKFPLGHYSLFPIFSLLKSLTLCAISAAHSIMKIFGFSLLLIFVAFVSACGKKNCKQYIEKVCTDRPQDCEGVKKEATPLTSDQCRIKLNNLQIEEQEKKLLNELK